jgi:hypothetical protein
MRFVLLSAILLASASEVVPQFTPRAQESLRRTFEAKHDLVLEGFKQTVGDGETAQLPGGARFVSSQRLVFDDEVGAVEAGRPLSLRRRFISLETGGDLAPPEVEAVIKATATSPLVGASVLYTWVPEEQEYGRFYDAREENEELLPGTAADPFLAFLQPPSPEAASWEVPASELLGLLAPGGDLGFAPGEEREGRRMSRTLVNGVGGGLEMAFGGDSEGSLRVSRGSAETDEAGTVWPTLRLSLDGRWRSTVTDRLNATLLGREQEQGSSFEHGSLTLGVTGTGTIRLDPETGRPRSLSLECVEDVSMRIVEVLPGGVRFRQEMAMRGRLSITHEVR